jgi:taurine dioxygenase
MALERVTTNIGAIIQGFDIHERYGDDVAMTLRQWLHEHGVLFFHCKDAVSRDDFRALGSLFGEMSIYSYNQSKNRSGDPVIAQIGDVDHAPPVRHRERNPASYWHTDGSAKTTPPQAALLTPIRLPSVGGDTMWASMTAAFEALSSRYQRMLDGMEAFHSTAAEKRHFPSPEDYRAIFGEGESCVHPVIMTDPVTRHKLLYVNSKFTEHIMEMTDWESNRLLDMLFDHINTPEFHVRLRWQPNTIAVWDERVTQHRRVDDSTEPRTMLRITIRGDRPVA